MNLVCGWTAGRVLAAAVCVFALVPQAFADGKVFRAATAVVPMVDQEAIICHNAGVEVLAIRTRADASATKGEPLAWVVPVPAVPELLTTTAGVFDTARTLTMPRLMQGRNAGPGWLLLGAAAFVLLIAAAARHDGGLPTRKRRVLLIVLVVVGFFMAVGVLLPALATSRGLSDATSADGVEVLKRERVGTLDIAVVRARDGQDGAKSLAAWLKDAGCAVPAVAEPALADYAARGWVFVAARLADPAANARTEPTPLVMRFASATPVYPMKLTGAGNGPLGLELCVLASGTASAPGMQVARSSPLRNDIDYSSEDVPLVHEGLKAIADRSTLSKGAWITRLTGRLDPAQQATDMTVTIKPGERSGEVFYTPAGAWRVGTQWGAWVVAAGFLALAVVFCLRSLPRKRSAQWILGSVAAGLLVSAAIATGLPQYGGEIKIGRRPESLAYSMIHAIEALDPRTVDEARSQIASKRLARVEPFASMPPEGDVPGGYLLSTGRDGNLEVDLYDRFGRFDYSTTINKFKKR